MRWDSIEPIRDLNEAPPRPVERIDPVCAVVWGVILVVVLAELYGILLVVSVLAGGR